MEETANLAVSKNTPVQGLSASGSDSNVGPDNPRTARMVALSLEQRVGDATSNGKGGKAGRAPGASQRKERHTVIPNPLEDRVGHCGTMRPEGNATGRSQPF